MTNIIDSIENTATFIKRNLTMVICVLLVGFGIWSYLDNRSTKVDQQNAIITQEVKLESALRDSLIIKYNDEDPELVRSIILNAIDDLKNSTQYKNLERQYAKLDNEQSNLNIWLSVFLFALGSVLSAGIIEIELYFMTKLNFTKIADNDTCLLGVISLIKTMYATNLIAWTILITLMTYMIK